MVFEYTNGCDSYIPCEKDFILGGYEAAVLPRLGAAFYYYSRTALSSQVEKQIKKGIKQVLRQIKKETPLSMTSAGVKR